MKRKLRKCGFSLLVVCILFAIPMTALSQKYEKKSPKIQITSYSILIKEFEKPVSRVEENGLEKTYTKAYVVFVKGEFGEPSAIPVDIFIGDYRVPEYGGSEDGIYFYIYEDRLLEELEDKSFGYGYENQKVEIFKIKFKPSEFRPFKKIEKKFD